MSNNNNNDDIDLSSELYNELSSDTLAALKQHLQTKQHQQEQINNKNLVNEDFSLSQFWYDQNTINIFVNEIYNIANDNNLTNINVALVSCPSIFYTLHDRMQQQNDNIKVNATIFEYDHRFKQQFPNNYQYYDFNDPTNIDRSLHNTYDIIIADPPYINIECTQKVGVTLELLRKKKTNDNNHNNNNSYIIYNTGIVLRQQIELLLDLKCVNFEPSHRVGLMNQFATYTSYNSKGLVGWRND